MAEIKFDDNLLVNRDDETYKVSGSRFLSGFTSPPDINRIDLAENNPGNLPRFTNQSFVASVTMDDEGEPISTKTFDAYVEGAIFSVVQFEEPLVSSSLSPGETHSNYVTSGETFDAANPPTNMFDGDLMTPMILSVDSTTQGTELWRYTLTQSVADLWNEATNVTFYQIAGNGTVVNKSCAVYRNTMDPANLLMSAGRQNTSPMSLYAVTGRITDWTAGDALLVGNYGTEAGGDHCFGITYTLNGVETVMADGKPEQTYLNFAAGTDMSSLAAGDSVSQPPVQFNEPLESSASAVGPTYSGQSTPVGAFENSNLAFNGSLSDGATVAADGTTNFNIFSGIQFVNVSSVRVYVHTAGAVGEGLQLYLDNQAQPGGVKTDEVGWVMFPSLTTEFSTLGLQYSNPVGAKPLIAAFEINGEILVDAAPITNLNFAAGTDMNFLALGDTLTQGSVTGTITSVSGTSVSVSPRSSAWTDGNNVTSPSKTAFGKVQSITDTTATIRSDGYSWFNGIDVTGPVKTIFEANAKKYVSFDSNGNVNGLLNSPQSPAYTTTDSNPTLTLTFPSTFDSGQAPDDELDEGVTLTVTATAENGAGISGPVSDTVQPYDGIVQFNEPLDSVTDNSGVPALNFDSSADMTPLATGDTVEQEGGEVISSNKWSDGITLSTGGFTSGTSGETIFDGNPVTYAFPSVTAAEITWTLPGNGLSGDLYLVSAASVGEAKTFQVRQVATGLQPMTITSEEYLFKGTPYSAFKFGQLENFTQIVMPAQTYPSLFAFDSPDNPIVDNEVIRVYGSGVVGSITDTTVNLTSSSGTWTDGNNVIGPLKQTIRSMTEAELKEQQLKFATYENRKDTACGEAALAAREQLRTALVEAGYTLPEIDSSYAYITGEPQAIDGYYPLFDTEAEAEAAGNGSAHTHDIDGVTYYMPDGGTPIYHGNYTVSNTDNNDTNSNNNGGY